MNKIQQNKFAIIGATLVIAGAIATGTTNFSNNSKINSQAPTPSHSLQTETTESTSASKVQDTPAPVVEIKTETSTREISFQTKTVNDATLAKGTTKVTTQGVNGLEETTYSVTYTDGKETSREVVKVEVVKEPITQVVAQGTYVAPQPTTTTTTSTSTAKPATTTTKPASQNCTNGTYVNSNGQTVCRPSSTNNGNASAICKDGTYSYSQHRRGTCSGHKGVKTWLKNLPN